MSRSNPSTASEPDFTYRMTTPEIEMVEILRLAHVQAFTITINQQDGVFAVRLADTAAGLFIVGSGPTFEAAWQSLPGAGLDLTLGERIAAFGKRAAAHLTIVRADT